MKRLTFLILLISSPLLGFSQPCTGFYFYTQEQIDSFPIKYPNCSEILGDIRVYGDDITNVDSLYIINHIHGNLVIGSYDSNPLLASISGFQNLTTLEGELIISDNDTLTTLHGLEGLDSIGGLIIGSNPYLSSLEGLNNIVSVGYELHIQSCKSLTEITALSNLSHIGHTLWFTYNDSLVNLNGLENVSSISGLTIIGNSSLVSLSGLDNITSIEGDVWISFNNLLESFNHLENLTSIGLSLTIRHHALLSDLSGLSNLVTVGGFLSIVDNLSLTSLTGLDSIDASLLPDIYICDNISLSHCSILSICNYLSNPNGGMDIFNNDIGCNYPIQVLDSCEVNAVAMSERYILDDLAISPNPFTTSTTLSFRLSKPENVQFTVYNVQSQIVYTIEEWREKGEQQLQWNVKGLPAGMYYFQIAAGDRIGSGKLVIK